MSRLSNWTRNHSWIAGIIAVLLIIGTAYALPIVGFSGYTAEVNDENQLETSAVVESKGAHVNLKEKRMFRVEFREGAQASGDCLFYMNNTDTSTMIVDKFQIAVESACSIYWRMKNTGTRDSATDLTPTNMNAGAGITATGDFEYGRDLDGGSATLSGGAMIATYYIDTANKTYVFDFENDIILPKNNAITMWAGLSGVSTTVNVNFFYHD